MKSQLPMWAILFTLISCGPCLGGEGGESDGAPPPAFLAADSPSWGLEPVRRRCVALVEPALFSVRTCARRLLPQAASPCVLAGLPGVLYRGPAGDRLYAEPETRSTGRNGLGPEVNEGDIPIYGAWNHKSIQTNRNVPFKPNDRQRRIPRARRAIGMSPSFTSHLVDNVLKLTLCTRNGN